MLPLRPFLGRNAKKYEKKDQSAAEEKGNDDKTDQGKKRGQDKAAEQPEAGEQPKRKKKKGNKSK